MSIQNAVNNTLKSLSRPSAVLTLTQVESGSSNSKSAVLRTTISLFLNGTSPTIGSPSTGPILPRMAVQYTRRPEQKSDELEAHDQLLRTLQNIWLRINAGAPTMFNGEDFGEFTTVARSLFRRLEYFHLKVVEHEILSSMNSGDGVQAFQQIMFLTSVSLQEEKALHYVNFQHSSMMEEDFQQEMDFPEILPPTRAEIQSPKKRRTRKK